MKLTDKVVVVTGGSAGLGEQICYEAAKSGAIVIVCARRQELSEKVRNKCMSLSQRSAFAFPLDVSDPTSVEQVISKIYHQVGRVDVLVNNAGFGLFENFVDFDLEIAQKMFNVNVLGMMTLTQKIAIEMTKQRSGEIINIASMAGKMATAKSTVYSATKFAVLGFSNALRLELKPFGIHVMTVNPGPIRTNFFDLADPEGHYLQNVDAIVLDPQRLAATIVKHIGSRTREINRPRIMSAAAALYTLFPKVGDFLATEIFDKK